MLRRVMFGVMPTRAPRGVVAACALLLVLALSLVACAGPTSASASGRTPISTPTTTPQSAQAAFQVVGLQVAPTEVSPGQEVTIIAEVANSGDAGGIYPARLAINDIAEVSWNVAVPAGGTQTLSFVVSKDVLGTYGVTVGELTGQFVVAEPVKSVKLTPRTITPATASQPTSSSCCGTTGSGCGCGGTPPPSESSVPRQRTGCGCR